MDATMWTARLVHPTSCVSISHPATSAPMKAASIAGSRTCSSNRRHLRKRGDAAKLWPLAPWVPFTTTEKSISDHGCPDEVAAAVPVRRWSMGATCDEVIAYLKE